MEGLRFSPNSKLLAFNSSLDSTAIEIINLDSMKVLDKVAGFIQSTADIIFTKDSKNILYTGLGSLTYLNKYNLSNKITTNIINQGTIRYLQLSIDEKNIFLNTGEMLYNVDISSLMRVEAPLNPLMLNVNINTSQNTLKS